MGLDMYLKAKKYIGNYDFRSDEKEMNAKIKEVIGLKGFEDDISCIEVTVTIAYWRKSNQIHKWFVDNCQGGIDECQESYIDREQLEKLRDLCNKVLAEKNANLLPPQSGFFFGSTEVDEWYWSDIEHTIQTLEKILADQELLDYDFYYQSSW